MNLSEFSKFNVKDIIVDHFESYKDNRNDKYQLGLITTVFFCPFLIGIVLGFLRLDLSQLTEILGNVYSIFCGLLFNLLVLMKNEYKEAVNSEITSTQKLIDETYANVSFCILVSLLGLLSLACESIPICSTEVLGRTFLCNQYFYLPNFFIVFLFLIFVFNLFMAIKRIYRICRPES